MIKFISLLLITIFALYVYFDIKLKKNVKNNTLKLSQNVESFSDDQVHDVEDININYMIKYKQDPNNKYPIIVSPAKEGDACVDLVAQRVIEEDESKIKYGTGLFVELPKYTEMQIRPRSSIYNFDLILANSPGTIDEGYRGEIMVAFKKLKKKGNFYKPGDRIAQFKIEFAYPTILEEIEILSETERGDGGFGSTGI